MATGFIIDLMNATVEFESPRRFWYWSGLAAISAILKNKVWLDREPKLYGNIYVFCVAPSGVRKGLPISTSRRLVEEVGNTRVISGRNSIQAIIKELATTFTRPGQPPITDACGHVNSGELSTVLIRDPEALTILTDLYDGHYNPKWNYTLKGSGKEELKGLGVSMLGAVNQTHLSDMLERKDISGGFMGRTLIVEEFARHCKNPFPHTLLDIPKLSEPLKEMAKLEGPMIPTDKARKLYENWYMEYEPEKRADITGVANRMSDHIMKVAMLLALSRAPKLIIEEEDVAESLKACSGFEQAAASVTKGKGPSEFAPKLRVFIDDLISARGGWISRSQILSRRWGDFDAIDLERMILTLEYSGALKKKSKGNEMLYSATNALLEQYGAFMERKENE
jgi:hypothetical protein